MRISDWSSDVCSSDLAVALDILVVGPAGVVDATANHHLHALVDILLDGLADAVEAGDAVPLGIFEAAVVVVLEDLAVAVTLGARGCEAEIGDLGAARRGAAFRSEEHTSELQSLMRISYAVFCLKKKTNRIT